MKSTPIICGLDLGSWTFKLCAFNGEKFEILVNEANFRETPSLVGYTPTERLIGEPALIKLKNNFANTIRAPQRLLGLERHPHLLEQQLKYQKIKFQCQSQIRFSVQGKQGQIQVSAEQVLISLIGKVKSVIESHNMQLSIAYITVPVYMGQQQRFGLKKSAQLALSKPVRIVDDWIALASQYSYTRIKELKVLEQMRHVIFLDVGYSKFSISLVQFTRFEGRLLDWEHLPYTGCKNMDRCIVQFYSQQFNRKHKLSILDTPKAYIKLLDAVQRQRTVLSANNDHHLNLQYLIGQEDLAYNMTREQFQTIVVSVLSDIAASMASFQSRNSSIPIHALELVGGGSRIPCIQSIASKIFSIDPSRTLNQSEALALGSTVFGCLQQKIINLQYSFDCISTRKIGIRWKNEKKELYFRQTRFPSEQSVNIGNEGTVQMIIFVEQSLSQKQIGRLRFKSPNKIIFLMDQNKILSAKAALHNFELCDLRQKSEKQWNIIKNREQEMQKHDLRMGILYEMKNDYESKFYWCKNKFSQIKMFADQKLASQIEDQIASAEKWIQFEHQQHGNGSEKDLQVFSSKVEEINFLKKMCEELQNGKRNVQVIKTRYDKLTEEIAIALQSKLSQKGQERLLQIMNWGQEAYQTMENHNWKGNDLSLQKIDEASVVLQNLKNL